MTNTDMIVALARGADEARVRGVPLVVPLYLVALVAESIEAPVFGPRREVIAEAMRRGHVEIFGVRIEVIE